MSVVAAIAPPIRMPAVGIAARGVGSKAPTAIRMPAAPTAGRPIATIARARAFGTPLMRPPEVSAAVATIAAMNDDRQRVELEHERDQGADRGELDGRAGGGDQQLAA